MRRCILYFFFLFSELLDRHLYRKTAHTHTLIYQLSLSISWFDDQKKKIFFLWIQPHSVTWSNWWWWWSTNLSKWKKKNCHFIHPSTIITSINLIFDFDEHTHNWPCPSHLIWLARMWVKEKQNHHFRFETRIYVKIFFFRFVCVYWFDLFFQTIKSINDQFHYSSSLKLSKLKFFSKKIKTWKKSN